MAGTFGQAPAQIAQPKSIYDELNQNVPGYGALTKSATGVIGGELNGQVSPETQNLIQNKAAAAGVAGGVPGSQFQQNNMLANLGLTSEQLQQHGLTDYNQFSGTTGGEQTDPRLGYEVSLQNAIDAAAPDPASAQSYAQMLFNKYLNPNPAGAGYQTAGSANVITTAPMNVS